MSVAFRLVLCAWIGALVLLLHAPQALLGLAALGLLTALWFAPDGRARQGWLGATSLLVWSSVLSQAWFWPNAPHTLWIRLGPVTLWREGALAGLVLALRVVSVTSAGLAVAWSSRPEQLAHALRSLHLPPQAAFLLMRAMYTVPEVLHAWREARAAWRGLHPDRRPPSLRTPVVQVGAVTARMIRAAHVRAEVLLTRGFDPAEDVDDGVSEGLSRVEMVLSTLFVALVLLLCVARLLDAMAVWGLLDSAVLPAWVGLARKC